MMKALKTLSILLVLAYAGVSMASTPIRALVPVDDVFTPKGFDSNDDVEIVVSGFLPNLCYKSPFTEVEVVDKTIKVTTGALNYDALAPYCLEMIVPFVEVVHVGLLDRGTYNIVVNGKSYYEKKGSIFVNEATNQAIDDHTYASVENILKEEGSRTVKLQGYNPSECFILDEIQVVSNHLNTYSILPKMKQVSDFCPMKMVPFTYEMEVPKTINKNKVLLHVRVMDGKSVNSVFNNRLHR
jgi:hypothetical protein